MAFTVLGLVLGKLAWKPLLSSLQSREEYIAGQLTDADNTRKKAEDVLVEYREKLAGAQEEGSKVIEAHTNRAQNESKEIVARAETEAQAIKKRAMADIERSRIEAEGELWVEAGDMVLKLGKEVLGKSMTSDDNQVLVDDAIAKFKAEEKQQ